MGTQRARRWLRWTIFAAVQLGLAVLLLEVALRLLKPRHDGLRAVLYRSATATDYSDAESLPELMSRTPGGFAPLEAQHGYVLNSRSFRTREYAAHKPAGTYRVVAMGDSFTYGLAADADHWVTRLEAGLAAARDEEVEVLRLGVPGTGMPFQLRLWQLEGARLEADLVILAFFVGNDFFDELGMAGGWKGFQEKLVTVSYTFRTVRNLLRLGSGLENDSLPDRSDASVPPEVRPPGAPRGGYELDGPSHEIDENRPTFSSEAYAAIEAQRMSICLDDESLEFDFRFDRVARLVERLHWEVEASGARLVVMILPDEFQIDAGVRAAAMRHAGRRAGDYDLERPQRRLRTFLEERGIDHLDLLPLFRDAGQTERLYRVRDSHWNRAGNHLAARSLLRYLDEIFARG